MKDRITDIFSHTFSIQVAIKRHMYVKLPVKSVKRAGIYGLITKFETD
jgi:hypothetical protein